MTIQAMFTSCLRNIPDYSDYHSLCTALTQTLVITSFCLTLTLPNVNSHFSSNSNQDPTGDILPH